MYSHGHSRIFLVLKKISIFGVLLLGCACVYLDFATQNALFCHGFKGRHAEYESQERHRHDGNAVGFGCCLLRSEWKNAWSCIHGANQMRDIERRIQILKMELLEYDQNHA